MLLFPFGSRMPEALIPASAVTDARSSVNQSLARRVAIGVLLAALLFRAALFIQAELAAIRYPWELDYGEGIVWQQMRWIFTAKAYGPIDQFPAIVFHYPPLYHAITSVVAGALGTDELSTGRALSFVCTLVAALASALIAGMLVDGRADRQTRRLVPWIARLLPFTYVPVVAWAQLMRVDMLAVALGLFGLAASFKALERPRLIYVASLLFVAAVYTKQTSIAAPAAALSVLLVLRPRLALQGIATCSLLGLAMLMVLGALTDGGFYRHIFLYNVNRMDPSRLWSIAYAVALQAVYVALAAFVVVRRVADIRSRHKNLRGFGSATSTDARLLIALAYLAMTTPMMLLIIKTGSNINYFLEWFFAVGIFASLAVAEGTHVRSAELRKLFALIIPLVLAVQALTSDTSPYGTDAHGLRARQLQTLSSEIKAADKPVISDDMVLLLRSGQTVLWESSIFAELASTGGWDERPFVQRIRNREFAFFITWGQRGHRRFDERYNPAVADAIDAAYPIKEEIAGLIVHRPRKRA